ncbi:hypothetical protein ACTOJ1_001645 [Shigella flexneri]
MKKNFIDIYRKENEDNIEKIERMNREITRKIEEENTFNSYRFDPNQVNYSL